MYQLSLLDGQVSLTVNTDKNGNVTSVDFVNTSGRKAGYTLAGSDKSKPVSGTKEAQTGSDNLDPGAVLKASKGDQCAYGLWFL